MPFPVWLTVGAESVAIVVQAVTDATWVLPPPADSMYVARQGRRGMAAVAICEV